MDAALSRLDVGRDHALFSGLARHIELRSFFRLASWLGPWRSAEQFPPNVSLTNVILDAVSAEGTALRARVYMPEDVQPIGSYVLAHGLNVHGPADPRCDRFARILAHAGFAVIAPELPGYTKLLVNRNVAQDLVQATRSWLKLWRRPRWPRPGLFGISFGAFPVLCAAGDSELAGSFGGVVTYGGYADFHRTLRFAMGVQGRDLEKQPVDGTCLPAVYLNVMPIVAPTLNDEERREVADAIRRYVSLTWGRPEMKSASRSLPVAENIANELGGDASKAFRVATGLLPGGEHLCSEALYHYDPGDLDPRPAMAAIRCPIHLLHSADDDVISSDEVHALHEATSGTLPVHVYLTGLYDHGGHVGLKNALLAGPALVREALTMANMVFAIIRGGTDCGR